MTQIQALVDLVQAYAHAETQQRQAIRYQVLSHPARQDARTVGDWVEALFRLGGPEVMIALATHALGEGGTAASRALAHQRSDEMQREQANREQLTTRTDSGTAETDTLHRVPLHPDFGDGVDDAAEITLDADALGDQLEALGAEAVRVAMLAAGIAPAVATDCDGTVWKHDIGEAMFHRAIQERLLRDDAGEALGALLRRFELEPRADVNASAALLRDAFESGELFERGRAAGVDDATVRAQYYAANVWCFAGHRVETLKGWARELFDGEHGFSGKLFDGICVLLERGRAHGLIPYAISASCQWIVEVGAEYLGIPPWRVAGVRTALRDGCVSTEILQPVTYGAGKVEAALRLCGGRPAVAMGDSVNATDRELLDSAWLRIAVEPTESRVGYVVARGAEHWRFLDFERTRDGEAADTFPPKA